MKYSIAKGIICIATAGMLLNSCECTEPSCIQSCPDPVYSGAGYRFPGSALVPLGVCPSARIVFFTSRPSESVFYRDLNIQKTISLDSVLQENWSDTTELRRITHAVVSPLNEPQLLVSATVIEKNGQSCAAFYVYDVSTHTARKLAVPSTFSNIDLHRTTDATARVWIREESGPTSFFRIGTTWFDLNGVEVRTDREDSQVLCEVFLDMDQYVQIRKVDASDWYRVQFVYNGVPFHTYDNVKAVSNRAAISQDNKCLVFEVGANTQRTDPNYGRRIIIVRREGTSCKVTQNSAPWLEHCLFARVGANPVFIDSDRLLLSLHRDQDYETTLGVYNISSGRIQIVDAASLAHLL